MTNEEFNEEIKRELGISDINSKINSISSQAADNR
jgi:hypothetical protein